VLTTRQGLDPRKRLDARGLDHEQAHEAGQLEHRADARSQAAQHERARGRLEPLRRQQQHAKARAADVLDAGHVDHDPPLARVEPRNHVALELSRAQRVHAADRGHQRPGGLLLADFHATP